MIQLIKMGLTGNSFAIKSDHVLKPQGRPEISMKGECTIHLHTLASHGQESKIAIQYFIPSLKIMSLLINVVGDNIGALSSPENLFLSFKRPKYLV